MNVITSEELDIIRETYIKLSQNSKNLFENFYSNFFELDPSAKGLFENVDLSKQKKMLFESVSYFINNEQITDKELENYTSILNIQHQSVKITTSNAKNFEKALLKTLHDTYGESFNDEIENTWKKLLDAIFKNFDQKG